MDREEAEADESG